MAMPFISLVEENTEVDNSHEVCCSAPDIWSGKHLMNE